MSAPCARCTYSVRIALNALENFCGTAVQVPVSQASVPSSSGVSRHAGKVTVPVPSYTAWRAECTIDARVEDWALSTRLKCGDRGVQPVRTDT